MFKKKKKLYYYTIYHSFSYLSNDIFYPVPVFFNNNVSGNENLSTLIKFHNYITLLTKKILHKVGFEPGTIEFLLTYLPITP